MQFSKYVHPHDHEGFAHPVSSHARVVLVARSVVFLRLGQVLGVHARWSCGFLP